MYTSFSRRGKRLLPLLGIGEGRGSAELVSSTVIGGRGESDFERFHCGVAMLC